MKKTIFFLLLLSTASVAFAGKWNVIIENATNYRLKIQVAYPETGDVLRDQKFIEQRATFNEDKNLQFMYGAVGIGWYPSFKLQCMVGSTSKTANITVNVPGIGNEHAEYVADAPFEIIFNNDFETVDAAGIHQLRFKIIATGVTEERIVTGDTQYLGKISMPNEAIQTTDLANGVKIYVSYPQKFLVDVAGKDTYQGLKGRFSGSTGLWATILPTTNGRIAKWKTTALVPKNAKLCASIDDSKFSNNTQSPPPDIKKKLNLENCKKWISIDPDGNNFKDFIVDGGLGCSVMQWKPIDIKDVKKHAIDSKINPKVNPAQNLKIQNLN